MMRGEEDSDGNRRTGEASGSNDSDDERKEEETSKQPTSAADNDMWASSSGYTPLAGLAASIGTMIMSAGPSASDSDGDHLDREDQDENLRYAGFWADSSEGGDGDGDGDGGIVFVNPSAFAVSAQDDDSDGDQYNYSPSHRKIEDRINDYGTIREKNNAIRDADFTSIADSALRALDDDYSNIHRTSDTAQVSSPDAANKTGNSTNDNLPTATSSPPLTHDDENKIIAAAIDEAIKQRSRFKDSFFNAHWESSTEMHPNTSREDTPDLKSHDHTAKRIGEDVDVQTVQRVVQAISTSNTALSERFDAWQESVAKDVKENSSKTKAYDRSHPLIPTTPLKAFSRNTPKAIQASATLSRAATLAEVLVRLDTWGSIRVLTDKPGLLVIHIIGVDHVECASIDRMRSLFCPLVRWIGNWNREEIIQNLELVLIGRELGDGNNLSSSSRVDLMASDKTLAGSIRSATATFHTGTYHEWLKNSQLGRSNYPCLAVAFNAGIWGYDAWLPTVAYLAESSSMRIPFVVTAYTLSEAQEDFATIKETVESDCGNCKNCVPIWEPESNAFGSRVIRETKSSSQEYRENAAWQAWFMGREATT